MARATLAKNQAIITGKSFKNYAPENPYFFQKRATLIWDWMEGAVMSHTTVPVFILESIVLERKSWREVELQCPMATMK